MSGANEPKYQIVKDYITQYIKKGDLKFDEKIFSELELMGLLNVSRHTIRKALDDLVNEGWLYKQQGKGTFVSNPEVHETRKGKLVGFIATYLSDYIFPEIISGIESVLSDSGYSIILGNTNNKVEKERTVLKSMLEHNLDGLILEPTKSVLPNHNKDLLQKFIERGIPILYIHAAYNNVPSSYIIEDDVKAGYMATEHLIKLGHRKIGAIFKNDDIQGLRRYDGYVSCLRAYDLPIDEESILWFGTEDQVHLFTGTYGEVLIKRFKDCSALVCYNDQIASNLLELFKDNHIQVPADCSIVSFDNSNLSKNAEVKLTTVAHPKSVLGERAATALLEIIQDKKKVICEEMVPELMTRESTQQFIKTEVIKEELLK